MHTIPIIDHVHRHIKGGETIFWTARFVDEKGRPINWPTNAQQQARKEAKAKSPYRELRSEANARFVAETLADAGHSVVIERAIGLYI